VDLKDPRISFFQTVKFTGRWLAYPNASPNSFIMPDEPAHPLHTKQSIANPNMTSFVRMRNSDREFAGSRIAELASTVRRISVRRNSNASRGTHTPLMFRFLRRSLFAGLLPLLLSCGNGALEPKPLHYDLTFDDSYAIYETPTDTLRVSVVMQDTSTVYDISWSPDGRQVAFTREYWKDSLYYRVMIYNTADGTERALTHGPDDSFQPAWSPDGTRIAYLSRPTNGLDATLRTVRPDGTDDRQLGTTLYYVRPADWSPDGRQIAATRNDFTVVVVDATTGDVTRAIGPGMSPTWSPDGRRLAFAANGITISNADGSNQRVIPFTAYEPAWSPDNDWIAVQAGDIYLIAPDSIVHLGSRDSTVIHHFVPGDRPAWRFRN
jgi:WD40 repeat protein